MAAHDALETDSDTVRREDPRSGTDRSGAVEPAGAATKRARSRLLPGIDVSRFRESEAEDVTEGFATESSASRDAIYRRLLAMADLVAAGAAFLITIPLLGDDTLGLGAIVAIAMVVLVNKLAGLYDRDEHLIHKTTLDEAPTLFSVAALYTLLAFLVGEAIVEGHLRPRTGDRPLGAALRPDAGLPGRRPAASRAASSRPNAA